MHVLQMLEEEQISMENCIVWTERNTLAGVKLCLQPSDVAVKVFSNLNDPMILCAPEPKRSA